MSLIFSQRGSAESLRAYEFENEADTSIVVNEIDYADAGKNLFNVFILLIRFFSFHHTERIF